ncbi:MAG: ribonuclease E/G [Candidatus Parvarchaeota archaeon]|nr:ribonuclease E/G [Candidatus Jingweiarchaeum tengchongense]MCW1298496.1 ribonuclease E/G [Candidatus Jingweiarchaeum tengchongense]MCW1300258.1 ribonuclease E/G [Candidatus Jingweiarchaeum tengchongense]MCW1304508.1 ribonuclease E/G [Candidatus Jingweiarchaeum tengchongense]MCW1305764.1 ribonuclease E/G [Candidatus Jingweiarchaeum tengchongense]
MRRVKIRGIYATALTKLLKDRNFEIVLPSEKISERFDLSNNSGADILIYDKEDMNGVTIHGNGCEEVISILKEEFDDVIIRKVESGAIYCGFIKEVDPKRKDILIDIGADKYGLLSLHNYWGYLREGEKVLVQVKGEIKDFYLLSNQLRMFGESLVLIKNGFTKLSKHIKNQIEKDKLLDLSKEAKMKGWGILVKSLAEGRDIKELRAEMERLIEKESEIRKRFENAEKPTILENGFEIYFVDFTPMSKAKLDRIRNSVEKTIEGHHLLKSGNLCELADFADSLIGEIEEKKIIEKISAVIKEELPRVGNKYQVVVKKLNGTERTVHGVISEMNDFVKIKRNLKAGRKYDALDMEIEEGDYALTFIKNGAWLMKNEYYNKDGKLKGKYFSITTAIELFPKFARCIDLELDVVENSNGERKIIDMEIMEEKIKEGVISKKMGDKAIEIANRIMSGELK